MSTPVTEKKAAISRPILSDAGLAPTQPVNARDEFGDTRELNIAGEFPLTIKVDTHEVVTLMTLGTYPEKLTLGYLRNQRLIDNISEIGEVRVDWDRETVDVFTSHGKGIINLQEKISRRTVTSGWPGHDLQLHPGQAIRYPLAAGRGQAVDCLRVA